MNGQEVTSVISTVTGLVPSNLSVNGLTSLLLQNDNDGFTCELCFKVLSSKNNLKKHMLIHSEAKYSCDLCDKKFTYKWNMESHRIVHTAEKPFKCDQCEAAFFRRTDLK